MSDDHQHERHSHRSRQAGTSRDCLRRLGRTIDEDDDRTFERLCLRVRTDDDHHRTVSEKLRGERTREDGRRATGSMTTEPDQGASFGRTPDQLDWEIVRIDDLDSRHARPALSRDARPAPEWP
jgi:hypothetical protein